MTEIEIPIREESWQVFKAQAFTAFRWAMFAATITGCILVGWFTWLVFSQTDIFVAVILGVPSVVGLIVVLYLAFCICPIKFKLRD